VRALEPAVADDLVAQLTGTSSRVLLQLERLDPAAGTVVYLSGSLVEGFGNASSDVDVFVVSDRGPAGPLVVRKATCTISIHLLGHRRADFEYWRPSVVDRIRKKLASIEPGEEFVAEKLHLIEELFVHRLLIGKPLATEEAFVELRDSFDAERFRSYLVQQAIHRADGALDDLGGMLEDDDLLTTLLRARDLVSFALDAYAHDRGNTNTLPKWRAKIVAGLPDDERSRAVAHDYRRLQFPTERALRHDPYAVHEYVRECIAFSNRVTAWIQP
jgi:predicted nucleotidyltransferase